MKDIEGYTKLIKQIRLKASRLSNRQIAGVFHQATDILQVFIGNIANPDDAALQNLRIAKKFLEDNLVMIENKVNNNRNDQLNNHIYRLYEILTAANDCIVGREKNLKRFVDARKEMEYAMTGQPVKEREYDPNRAVKIEDGEEYETMETEHSSAWSNDDSDISETTQHDVHDEGRRIDREKNHSTNNTPNNGPSGELCDICGRKFESSGAFKRHRRTHQNSGQDLLPNKCDECGKAFVKKIQLENHKKTHLPDDDPRKKKVECGVCGKLLTDEARLAYHMQLHILDKNDPAFRPFQCEQCGKCFRQAQNLKHHLTTHSNDETVKKPHVCDICGTRFTHPGSLAKHRPLHLPTTDPRNKKFECDVCGMIISTPKNLRRHKLQHLDDNDADRIKLKRTRESNLKRSSGEKVGLKCEVCGKFLARSDSLRDHMNLHKAGDAGKPYKCGLCEKSFSHQDYLKRHRTLHLNGTWKEQDKKKVVDERSDCDLCGSHFSNKSSLRRHLRNIHKVAFGIEKKAPANSKSSAKGKQGKVVPKEKGDRSAEEETDEKDEEDENRKL